MIQSSSYVDIRIRGRGVLIFKFQARGKNLQAMNKTASKNVTLTLMLFEIS